MVFTVSLKWLSFKQNLRDITSLYSDQISTYVILKYAYDLPSELYSDTLYELSNNKDSIFYPKLQKLVDEWLTENSLLVNELKAFEDAMLDHVKLKLDENISDDGFVIDELDNQDEEEDKCL